MSDNVAIGKLVRFLITETGVDTVFPMGMSSRNLVGRLAKSGNYEPRFDEIGLVIGGPGNDDSCQHVMWEVLVNEKKWWFLENELTAVNNDI